MSGNLPPGVTDRDIDAACQHEQHESCPMDGDRCGCYVGREACLKIEREMQRDLQQALRFGRVLDQIFKEFDNTR